MSTTPSVVLNAQIPDFQRILSLAPPITTVTPTNVNTDIDPEIETITRNMLVVMTVMDVVERDGLVKILVVPYHLPILVHALVLPGLSLVLVAQDLALVVLASTPTLLKHLYISQLQTISLPAESTLISY